MTLEEAGLCESIRGSGTRGTVLAFGRDLEIWVVGGPWDLAWDLAWGLDLGLGLGAWTWNFGLGLGLGLGFGLGGFEFTPESGKRRFIVWLHLVVIR
jgi:hypothetical protein